MSAVSMALGRIHDGRRNNRAMLAKIQCQVCWHKTKAWKRFAMPGGYEIVICRECREWLKIADEECIK